LLWRCDPTRVMASSFLRFLDHTQRRTTVGRTPLDESSACHRDLYLTTHNTHNRQISMPPVGFKPTISVGERPQNYALDRYIIYFFSPVSRGDYDYSWEWSYSTRRITDDLQVQAASAEDTIVIPHVTLLFAASFRNMNVPIPACLSVY
jgi:hypothetical protein